VSYSHSRLFFFIPRDGGERQTLLPRIQGPPTYELCDKCPLNREIQVILENYERRITSIESDLKEIRIIAGQAKLLFTLSIGGGGLALVQLLREFFK
jgi:hypothetical protein